MTEKDFRKIVTDLELTKKDKEEINEFIINLTNNLKLKLKNLELLEIKKTSSTLNGVIYHGSKNLNLMIVFKTPVINSYPLMNQAAINEIWNYFVFEYNLDKTNQISINEQTNSINVTLENYNLTLDIRFEKELNYQTNFYLEQDEKRNNFVNLAVSDFNLFKNTLQLIYFYRDEAGLNSINDYLIQLLLYYGLSVNFTKHTYELYLKEFNHAIDDLIKGIKIDQDDETYRKMKIERVNLPKKQYMIIDIANPKINLASGFGEAMITDFRKLKKIIIKLIEQ